MNLHRKYQQRWNRPHKAFRRGLAAIPLLLPLILTISLILPTLADAPPNSAGFYKTIEFTESEVASWSNLRGGPDTRESVSYAGREQVLQMGVDSDNAAGNPFNRLPGLFKEGAFGNAAEIDLYIDPAWQNTAVRAGFWFETYDEDGNRFPGAQSHLREFPRIEFTTTGDFEPGATGDNEANQPIIQRNTFRVSVVPVATDWQDVEYPVAFGEWVRFRIAADTDERIWKFYINSELVAENPLSDHYAQVGRLILHQYNYGRDGDEIEPEGFTNDSYDIHWHSLTAFHQFSTIKDAIDAAVPNTTIHVGPGTHVEDVQIPAGKDNLTIVGAGIGETEIEGGVRTASSSLTLSDMTLAGGGSWGDSGNDFPAVWLEGGTTGHDISSLKLEGPASNPLTRRGLLFGINVSDVTVENVETTGWHSGVFINPSNNIEFRGLHTHGNLAGIGSDGISNVMIENSVFADNEQGFGLGAPVGENVSVTLSSFTGNDVGIGNFDPNGETINASANYWGTTDPAAVEAMINGDVDFTPLLHGGDDLNPGFDPNLSELTIHELGEQVGPVGRIQEGINLVENSTVHVAAGTYVGAITIDKSVALLGAQAGQDPVEGGRTGGESIIHLDSGTSAVTVTANEVTIDGFEIRGFGRDGINVRTFDEAHPTDPSYGAYRHDISILNNWIHVEAGSNQRNGILFGEFTGDPDRSTQDALITNLAVQNNLLNIVAGTGRGIALTNHFATIVYENVTIEDNVIKANQFGLFASATPHTYEANNVHILNNGFEYPGSTAINFGNLDATSKVNHNWLVNSYDGALLNWREAGGEIKNNIFDGQTNAALFFFDDSVFPFPLVPPDISDNTFRNGQFGVRNESSHATLNVCANTFENIVAPTSSDEEANNPAPFAACDLTVSKVVVGPTPEEDWDFIGPTGAFSVASNANTILSGFAAGPVTLIETGDLAYDTASSCSTGTTGDNSISVDASPIHPTHCTFTNTAYASLTISKTVVGNAPASNWFFETDNLTPEIFPLSPGGGELVFANLLPGQYSVTEAQQAGYSVAVECTNGTMGSDNATLHLAAGDHVTCVFTNTQLASLTVVKAVQGSSPDSDWQFTGSGGLGDFILPAAGGIQVFNNLAPGSYTLSETVKTGYGAQASCTPNHATGAHTVTVEIGPGDNVSCTFTNALHAYTIAASASPDEGGSVTGAGSYAHGATVNLNATANMGYTFVNWTKNGSEISTDPALTFTASANRELVANFELNQYTITASASPDEGGAVEGGGDYAHGETVVLTATASAGYTFLNWTEGGSVISTDPTFSFPAAEDRELVANFTQNQYTITASASPAEGGVVDGDGVYAHGETVVLTATPNADWAFVNWTEGETTVWGSPVFTFTASADRTLVVHFVSDTTPVPPVAAISLVKTVGVLPSQCAANSMLGVLPGETVYYCYTMVNTGNVTLTNHTLIDNQLGTILPATVHSLAPGESLSTVQLGVMVQADIVLNTTNIATWTASALGGEPGAAATAQATVNVGEAGYTVEVEGSFTPPPEGDGTTGGEMNYQGLVQNTGTATLKNIKITFVVPEGTVFSPGGSVQQAGATEAVAADAWDCPAGAPAGTVCTYTVDVLLPGQTVFVAFAVRVVEEIDIETLQVDLTVEPEGTPLAPVPPSEISVVGPEADPVEEPDPGEEPEPVTHELYMPSLQAISEDNE